MRAPVPLLAMLGLALSLPAFAGASGGGWCVSAVCVQTCMAEDACVDPEACLRQDPQGLILGECADLTRECMTATLGEPCGPPQ